MFSVSIETSGLVRKIEEAERRLNNTGDVLQDVGVYVLGEVRKDFETLSRGGTSDADGRKWKPLAKSTEVVKAMKGGWRPPGQKKSAPKQNIFQVLKAVNKGQYDDVNPPKSQVGVDTGMLRNASAPGVQGNVFKVDEQQARVTIGYGVKHARYFNSERPLLPERVPTDWSQGCVDLVQEWFRQVIEPLDG